MIRFSTNKIIYETAAPMRSLLRDRDQQLAEPSPIRHDQRMWTELIAALPDEASLHPPAPESAIHECERLLGERLPGQLAALLGESNGVDGEYGLGLIWPIGRIIADNLHFRSNAEFAQLYMPFDPLLFFADAGNGDQFALVPHTGRPDVFVWDHENDSRIWVAPGLSEYLRWWTTGHLKL